MYTAEYAGRPLYDPRSDFLQALDQSCRLSVSEAGEYRFALPATHPLAGRLAVMDKGREVALYEDGAELFRGRVSSAEQSMEGSWSYVCEGQRAYLNDVLLDPYEAGAAGVPSEPSALFEWYLAAYNSAVPEAERVHAGRNEGWMLSAAGWEPPSSTSRASVWSELKANLVDALGGFVLVRREHGARWLDWLADGTRECAQRVEFGANLTDFARTLDGSQVATCVKPWCAHVEPDEPEDPEGDEGTDEGDEAPDPPEYDTIAGVPDRPLEEGYWKLGAAVVDVAATESHGRVEAELECAAGTPAEEMVAQALQWIKNRRIGDTVQVSAVDLHRIDPSADPIRLGDFVRVTSSPHGYDAYLLCTELEVRPGEGDATYTLGTSYDTLTGQQSARLAQLSRKLAQTTERAEAISQEAKDAVQAAQGAQESADAAQGSADAAQSAADAAQQAADEAFERGQQAAQAAADAQSSADSAGQRADAAQLAADAAQAAAEAADGKAQAAAESAGEAAGRADAAQDAADDALAGAQAAAERADELAGEISDVSVAVDGLSATVSGASETAAEALRAASSAQQDISGFRTTVEQTYETKADADAAMAQERLDRQSAVEQSAGQILSTVAQTYATSKQVGEVSEGLADVVAAQGTLQSQVDQQAGQISQAVSSVEAVRVDAQAAQAAADKAQGDAEAAAQAASDAGAKADAAQAEAQLARSDAEAADARAQAAQTAADAAQGAAEGAALQAAEAAGIAGGKADVVFGDSEPAADMRKATTLWIDTAGGANTPKRWTGTAWAEVTDGEARRAAQAAAEAKSAADAAQASADAAQGAADQADAKAQAAQGAADSASQAAQQAQADADAAGAKADEAAEAVGELADRVSSAETRIDQTEREIALMATLEEVEQALSGYYTAEQTDAAIELRAGEVETSVSEVSARVDGAEGEIEALSTSVSQTTESITESISRKTAEIEGLQGSLEGLGGSLGELAGRLDGVEASFSRGMDAEGNPTLTLSTTANGLSTVLSNTSLGFYDGGQEVASVGGKAFNANDMRVSGQLSMGGYAWVPDASGDGLSLIWMGE